MISFAEIVYRASWKWIWFILNNHSLSFWYLHSNCLYIWQISFQGYSPLGSPGNLKSDILKNPVVVEIADKLGKTPGQVALRWGLQSGHSVLPKSNTESRIKENFDVFDWSIPEELFAKFSEIKQASFQILFLALKIQLTLPKVCLISVFKNYL